MPNPLASAFALAAKVRPGLTRSMLKVLRIVYMVTDCSNEVYDFAMLHHTQQRVAAQMPDLLQVGQCVAVDGNGFVGETERWGPGFRLTRMGYEVLTAFDPEGYPVDKRRFALIAAVAGLGGA